MSLSTAAAAGPGVARRTPSSGSPRRLGVAPSLRHERALVATATIRIPTAPAEPVSFRRRKRRGALQARMADLRRKDGYLVLAVTDDPRAYQPSDWLSQRQRQWSPVHFIHGPR
jgi:hypothetical protein